ncbi:uncharacterized protein LOC133275596 [Pezoporus flaviventris]|uniref:uncharacterized protein LOC133275596 n=1 Tax=Pezoporus flaviventris TaxID=889875 RepID=UPI002AB23337|nr:uncharacterized protein LOC133275596 [Pezoporus flaviventris]
MQRGGRCRCIGLRRGGRRGHGTQELLQRGLGAKWTEPGTVGPGMMDPVLRLETQLGDAHRAGLDACCWDPMGLERMGQRACDCCQEGLEMERRKRMALQEEKLELQKRLRELEHRSHCLLRQRQEVLCRLHVLLLKEKVDALQQLQEALEQQLLLKERAVRTARLQHRLSHPWEQAGSCPATGTTSACPCQHNLHPMGQGPLPAAVSPALRVLCGLRDQIQQHIRELQREPRDAPAEGGRDGVKTRAPVPPLPCP